MLKKVSNVERNKKTVTAFIAYYGFCGEYRPDNYRENRLPSQS